MNEITNFNEENHFAQQGEHLCAEYLKSIPSTYEVYDVRHYEDCRENDIDFFWIYRNNNKEYPLHSEKKIDIKTDKKRKWGNFFFETISNCEKNSLGCFLKTDSDYFLYLFVDYNYKTKKIIKKYDMYFLEIKPVREWFHLVKDNYEDKFPRTYYNNNDKSKGFYTSKGKAIPINDVLKAFPETITVTFNEFKKD
jgi:hypothetical protein